MTTEHIHTLVVNISSNVGILMFTIGYSFQIFLAFLDAMFRLIAGEIQIENGYERLRIVLHHFLVLVICY